MRLLIVDDHSLLLEGLTALLRQLGPDTEVLSASDGPSALDIAAQNPNLDCVILDLAMPEMDGLAVLDQLGARRPSLPVIVLSGSERAADVRRAMAHGALGYVPKSANPQTLLSALKLVLAGEIYVPPLMLNESGEANGAAPKLTPRQADVLACMSQGLSNKTTAQQLDMSEKTVKAHVTAILRALGASNRVRAVALAREHALVP